MWAADQGHAAAIQLLLEHGADMAARSNRAAGGRRGPPGNRATRARATDNFRTASLPVKTRRRRISIGRRARCTGSSRVIPLPPGSERHGNSSRISAAALLLLWCTQVRANSLDSAKALLAAGADVNQTTGYGWSPLLVATQHRVLSARIVSARQGRGCEPAARRRGTAALPRR